MNQGDWSRDSLSTSDLGPVPLSCKDKMTWWLKSYSFPPRQYTTNELWH